jgi:NAD(P)-dependent dehydrogenase (short-subunit alcohol dehydrogenase family)
LNGRTVVVTGGAGALGEAVLDELLNNGAICHVLDRQPMAASRSAHLGHVKVVVHPEVSVTDEAQVVAAYDKIGEIDASIHLVGGFAMGAITDTSANDARRLIELNYISSFLCSREAVRHMGSGGRIVNVVARPALTPCGGMIAYSASKAAVASLTQSLACEVRAQGILVNAVAPSLFDTPANREAMPAADHSAWPKPSELARAIAFLASADNALTSGALIPVYGRA